MKKLKPLLSFILITLIFSIQSCKYKDGPLISLRSKKARVDGTWKLDREFINGEETKGQDLVDSQQSTGILEFKKNGDFIMQDPDTKEYFMMKWEFADNKKRIKFIYDVGDYSFAKILRLKNKELWLLEDIGTSKIESHYVPS